MKGSTNEFKLWLAVLASACIVIGMTLGILGASVASADVLTRRPDLQRDLARAERFWRDDSTCRHVAIRRELAPDETATADWFASAGRGDCLDDRAGVIYLTPYQPVLKLGGTLAPRWACTIIVREVGTLLGYPPSDDPANIMFGGSSAPDGSFLAPLHRIPHICRVPWSI